MDAYAKAPSSNGPYDVFINHRGHDMRKTLASLLYHRLTQDGVLRVFWDKTEMQQSDELTAQIKNAIRTASVHIAIFSKTYAKSSWCLDELCLMLESRAPIIPVFYDVKPCHLRWMDKKGPYAKAFKMHTSNNRYAAATIQGWKTALHQVSNLSGYELEACNGDLGELLEKIVERVLRKIEKSPFHVAENPVGLEEAVQDFEQKMLAEQQQEMSNNNNNNVTVVGIVGLGGVGKTTLATELFNRKRSGYGGASYLDIREAALNVLQSRLLKDLSHVDSRIGSVNEGKGILLNRLSSCHALIVLDNVDRREHLDAFLPLRDVLRSGSLILVTSRHKDLLSTSGISLIHELRGLNKKHSEELFCWHAFQKASPPPEFQDLVEQYLGACCGLPLSLKVIGALLYGNYDHSFWLYQLDKLSKILPTEITERFKISFDALDRFQKQIFLDIACFFVGEDKDLAIRVWDGSNWNGMQGLQTLKNKCLVEVDDKNVIKMHDNLRDMGRNIAEDESLDYPRRFWKSIDIHDLPKQLSQKMEVRGIRCICSSEPSRLARHVNCISPSMHRCRYQESDRSCFDAINGLKLLTTQGDAVRDIFVTRVSPTLVWLRWFNCPYTRIPWWIPLENLRVLELNSQENFTTLWGSRSQVPVELRELNICSTLSNFPESLGQLTHLEKLVLGRKPDNKEQIIGSAMTALPKSFCHLRSLKHMELIGCQNLKLLPKQLGNLTNLQHISLSYCRNLEELPKSFSNLVKLKYLCLKDCTELNISGHIFEKFSTLESLNLKNCKKVEALPIDIDNQRHLKVLNVGGTSLKELPDQIGELSFLKALKLGSPFLKDLPQSIGRLTSLERLKICESRAESLPAGMGEMRSLGSLVVRHSPLTHVPEQVELGASFLEPMFLLKRISLHGTKISMIRISEKLCPNLQDLDLSSCHNLENVKLELPRTLVKLDLSDCRALKIVSGLFECVQLRDLDIGGCEQVKDLPSFEHLISLEKLCAKHCYELRRLKGLQKLPNLREVDVSLCYQLKWLAEEAHSGSLESILGLAGNGRLPSLEKLYAGGCWQLQSIEGLQQLERLKELQISPAKRNIWNEVQSLECKLRSLVLSANLGQLHGVDDVESVISSFGVSLSVLRARRESPWKLTSPQCSSSSSVGLRGKRKFPWRVKLPASSSSGMLCFINEDRTVYVVILRSTGGRELEGDVVVKCRNGSVELCGTVSDSLLLEIPVVNRHSQISIVDAWMVTKGREDEAKLRELWNTLCTLLSSN